MNGLLASSAPAYGDVVERFQALIRHVLPPEAIVAVVSRGDADLLQLDGIEAWHFPQRGDGVYLGYYPPDNAAAIRHLETLRDKGAEFLAIPANSLWWLEHYSGFARHLDERYDSVLDEKGVCAVYALVEQHGALATEPSVETAAAGVATPVPAEPKEIAALPARSRDDARLLFDPAWYAGQAGIAPGSDDELLSHYLRTGHLQGYSPHPLFDARWYAARFPQVHESGLPALIHFLEHGVEQELDPHPWFDSDYYYAQRPNLRKEGVNALVHYVVNAPKGSAAHPNALFRDPYYLRTYADVRGSGMAPFEHFLRIGRTDGRYTAHFHRNMLERLRRGSARSLVRGKWKLGTALIFAKGAGEGVEAETLAERLEADYRIDSSIVTFHRNEDDADAGSGREPLVLEDYELACEILRPCALRLLAATLAVQRPVFVLTDLQDLVETIADSGTPAFLVSDEDELEPVVEKARRVVVPTRALARVARRRGAGVSVCAPGDRRAARLAKLVGKELKLERKGRVSRKSKTRKILIPCSDWNVSGVNAALEAAGRQLIEHDWDVELVFTRNRDAVLESAGDETHLPSLPYRFLERTRPGVDGMWEALLSDIERSAPCILFLAYDFIANCVVPALTDDVGVVSWVQADDGDYYEQVYRLGRYCNAIVCVSSRIRDNVTAHNPAVGERAHVIHNSSVGRDEVLDRRPESTAHMRLVYTGRLVQYQKRILDYVELARALDRTGVPYELSLVGSFVDREGSQAPFEAAASDHLADGRIRLTGRLSRTQILDELSANAFFVLLSDFEGLPLALVEAMGRGCVPIVAESESGIPELVSDGENGIIVSGRDYDRWAALLVDLWENESTVARISRNARDTVLDRFTVEHIGDQFNDLFEEVAAEISTGYRRPPALHWGVDRSPTGDVLAAPSLFRPGALQTYPGLT
jgi:glycosyltransferase involved in cell wall biosynthesis